MKYYLALAITLAMLFSFGIAAAQETQLTSATPSDTVIISSDNEADQAVSGALAANEDGQVVTAQWGVDTTAAVNSIASQVQAKSPKTIIIVGGNMAIPASIEAKLKALGFTVKRLGGADRYETSAQVAGEWGSATEAVVAQGDDDAGLAEALTEAKKVTVVMPILLVKKDSVPGKVREKIMFLKIAKAKRILSADAEETVKEALNESGISTVEEIQANRKERAETAIEKATEALNSAKTALTNDSVVKNVAQKLVNNAQSHLDKAKEALNAENYGAAFGQAVSARAIATNSERLMKNIQVTAIARVHKVEAAVKTAIKARIAALKVKQERLQTRLEAINKLKATILNKIKARINVQTTEQTVDAIDTTTTETVVESGDLDAAITTMENTETALDSAETQVTTAESVDSSAISGGEGAVAGSPDSDASGSGEAGGNVTGTDASSPQLYQS